MPPAPNTATQTLDRGGSRASKTSKTTQATRNGPSGLVPCRCVTKIVPLFLLVCLSREPCTGPQTRLPQLHLPWDHIFKFVPAVHSRPAPSFPQTLARSPHFSDHGSSSSRLPLASIVNSSEYTPSSPLQQHTPASYILPLLLCNTTHITQARQDALLFLPPRHRRPWCSGTPSGRPAHHSDQRRPGPGPSCNSCALYCTPSAYSDRRE
jgi:hypothetical protein